MMKPSGVQVNKPVLAFLVVVVVALVWYLTSRSSTTENTAYQETNKAAPEVNVPVGQDSSGDAGKGKLSEGLKDLPKIDVSKITVKPTSFKVKAGTSELDVTGLEVVPTERSKIDVLLLHGSNFSPKNWEETKTLQLFGGLGYRMLAIQLPATEIGDKVEFMSNLIQATKLEKPVIISPSASGSYSIPTVVKSPVGSLRGFVALAPTDTEKFAAEYKSVKVPTLILYGDQDTRLGKLSYDNLINIPNSKGYVIKDGKHPFYIDTPDIFHKYLFNFLESLHA